MGLFKNRVYVAIVGFLIVAANQVMAFPRAGVAPLIAPPTPRINAVIHPEDMRDFEELIGRRITSSEINQIQRIADQTRALNEDDSLRPQNVRWDLGNSGFEYTVLICGQFKLQVDKVIPQALKDKLSKVPGDLQGKASGFLNKFSGELLPCFDPHTGMSYIMGGSSVELRSPSIFTMGLSVGLYFNHKSEKLIVGNYFFGRFTWDIGAFGKWDLTGGGDLNCSATIAALEFDIAKCRRFFISTGLGFDLFGGLFRKLKTIRKQANASEASGAQGKTLDLGMWSFSTGAILKLHEFPWYDRMRQGADIQNAFSDLAQYTK